MLQRYTVLRPIMLSFLTAQDQIDCTIGSGHTIVANDHTIWLVDDATGGLRESITTTALVIVALECGDIVESAR